MNHKDNTVLSGEQALDDYFTALLDEEWMDEPDATEEPAEAVLEAVADYTQPTVTEPSADIFDPGTEPLEPAPKPIAAEDIHIQTSYVEPAYNDFEVPDLEDVQKLLDKLESTDLAGEPEIVSILEQNNHEISRQETATEAAEEIQEWTVTETEEVVAEAEVPQTVELVEPKEEIVSYTEETAQETQSGGLHFSEWTSTERSEDFQVLYFDVNGVTFAVPLDELGGIHRKGEMSHLIGRPDWYLGLQTNKEDQFDVVDTAKWVMADRLRDDSYKENYQYVVMLGLSNWGLASTELKGTETLNTEKVRWREMAGKRPWLAGMVKEKMCALIHVEALVTMLNAGLDVKSLDS